MEGAPALRTEPGAMKYVSFPAEHQGSPLWSGNASGPWAEKRLHVTGSDAKNYQMYGPVAPQSWTEMAKEWANGIMGTRQDNRIPADQYPVKYGAEAAPLVYEQGAGLYGSRPAERFVIEAPPQPVYERVVFVPTATDPKLQRMVTPRALQQQFVTMAPPQPILIPLESEIVCRGHPSDRTELCFGFTLPPRQLKFDIVREEASGCFGLCRSQRFKAVCRKCRAVMPPCQQCGKHVYRTPWSTLFIPRKVITEIHGLIQHSV
ncbi:uncharacterized protein LOC34620512 [Cyclospora cayetanensis]|uniref:Uncharacterized protein LOC34620512 n=1 Tax=Cyclospora cayetanensis TaxID=88456 RepID=A0A6P5WDF5_9EIME|nr:uncharacterized protein LOC34620512 [Cyclospora cayetanensis]